MSIWVGGTIIVATRAQAATLPTTESAAAPPAADVPPTEARIAVGRSDGRSRRDSRGTPAELRGERREAASRHDHGQQDERQAARRQQLGQLAHDGRAVRTAVHVVFDSEAVAAREPLTRVGAEKRRDRLAPPVEIGLRADVLLQPGGPQGLASAERQRRDGIRVHARAASPCAPG